MGVVNFTAPVDSYESIDASKKTTDRIALIDADRYKHVVTYRMYQKIMLEGNVYSKPLLHQTIDEYLSNDIFNKFEAKAYVFCFSAPSGKVFRNHIAQEKKYKGHRKGEDKYFYTGKYEDMSYIYEYINQRYETLYFDDLEADDLLSMLQGDETFIFSHDKDLKQVPGFHWDMKNLDWIYISEQKGMRSLFTQILTGDSTDNFGGLKGFGQVSLNKLIKEVGPDVDPTLFFYKVIKLYIDKYGLLNGVDSFSEMWNMASMKINRGDYLKEKYASAFELINTINGFENR